MTRADSKKTGRKPIPKSIRFEVFKRDSFKCQYCGASAPDVLLQVDHIRPIAAGGSGEIINLITACAVCNAGKRDKLLNDKTVVKKRKVQLDELQERREQLEMMMEWMEGLRGIESQAADNLADHWAGLAPGFHPNERGRQKIRKWLNRFSVDEIANAMSIAAGQYLDFQNDGKVTQESWETAFDKIAPILSIERDAKEDPDLKELLYIRGIVRNRCPSYFSNPEALEWLKAARSWGVPMVELRQLALRTRNWNNFVGNISEVIDAWKGSQED